VISDVDFDRLRAGYQRVRDELLAERTPDGHWVGELSSSALSTATAVSALSIVRRDQAPRVQSPKSKVQRDEAHPTLDLGRWTLDQLDCLIGRGAAWLVRQQNADGGFGDTDLSHSNIATTYLVIAALHLAGVADDYAELLARANAYIDSKGRLSGLRERYGVDKTFVVPIMTNLALAGLVDWHEVDALPFELACVPQAWYRFVGMPVVSYAIPALVAIGQACYFHAPPRNPLTRIVRRLSIGRSLKVLRRMQPESGGYLEATPLTSFVVMSLTSLSAFSPRKEKLSRSESRQSDQIADEVIREGVKFLVNSVRPDGSWPIDTNLAVWNTTLAVNALAGAGENAAELLGPQCLGWLLSCQHTKRHAFTGADPGGFGWSDLSGAVPDADDTPGAILALYELLPDDSELGDARFRRPSGRGWKYPGRSANWHSVQSIADAIEEANNWLAGLQNRDGGWPTFCRGWGKLPFDRSGADLTAHALRAVASFEEVSPHWLESSFHRPVGRGGRHVHVARLRPIQRGLRYVRKCQHTDGSWSPLWFGNQDRPDEDNPVYGTAKVLLAYRDLGLMDSPEARRGVAWLLANQNEDGGWGSGVWGRAVELKIEKCKLQIANCDPRHPSSDSSSIGNLQLPITNLQSSIEETALAVEALLAACPSPQPPVPSPISAAVARGLAWLMDRVEAGEHRQPAPIGFYFAKLWYYERLYPLTFTVAALGRACRQFAREPFSLPESTIVRTEPASDAP